nr:hypothetical protein [Tanacetum cinerariifolium]
EEEEEHLALTVPAPAQYSSVFESDETEPFEEGETAATPPPFGYRIAARISVQPHILMTESREVHTSTLVTQMEALRREKMAPKRSTMLNLGTTPVTTPPTTTTSVTNAQLQAMINDGVNAALAARDATRNGDDSHISGTGARRPIQAAREYGIRVQH